MAPRYRFELRVKTRVDTKLYLVTPLQHLWLTRHAVACPTSSNLSSVLFLQLQQQEDGTDSSSQQLLTPIRAP